MTLVRRLSFALAMTALAVPSRAATWCVNTGGTAPCFGSINEAADSPRTRAGDIIKVLPGRYRGSVFIHKAGLQVIGASALGVIIDSDLTGNGFVIDGANVNVQSLTIRNGVVGVVVAASGIMLQRLRILAPQLSPDKLGGYGIEVQSGHTGTQLLFNEVRAAETAGILLSGGNDGTVIKSNTLVGLPTGIDARGTQGDTPVPGGANLQIVGNTIQVAALGIAVIGDAPTIRGNVLAAVDEGIQVTGPHPVVEANRSTGGGTHLAQVGCVDDCAGGSVKSNTATGTAFGIAATATQAGLVVEGNRMIDSAGPYFFAGTGIQARLNTASGVTSIGYFVASIDSSFDKNSATHCGAAAYYVTGERNALTANIATYSGPFGYEILGPNNSLSENRATDTDGQAFGIVQSVTGDTTLLDNSAARNRVDFCNESPFAPAPPVGANSFDPALQSTVCDIPFLFQ